MRKTSDTAAAVTRWKRCEARRRTANQNLDEMQEVALAALRDYIRTERRAVNTKHSAPTTLARALRSRDAAKDKALGAAVRYLDRLRKKLAADKAIRDLTESLVLRPSAQPVVLVPTKTGGSGTEKGANR